MVFGWRARIGLISPGTSGIHTSAIEMERLAPEGVLFVSRFLDGPRSLALEDLRAMLPQVEPAARSLAGVEALDAVVVAGAPVVLANDAAMVADLVQATVGRPTTTNVAGIANGLRRLAAGRVVVVTPYYPPDVVALVRAFLEHEGFEIVAMAGDTNADFGRHKDVSPFHAYRECKRAFLEAPPADALVVVGGGAPLSDVIDVLETDIGRPVVASNVASLWNVLTLANVRQPIRGAGALLTCF